MVYSYEEAFRACLDYFNGEELSAKVFVDKYALRNNENEILEKTPNEMHRRLAKEFARIESKKFKKPLSEETIYNLFKNYGTIIPQGSPIYGIGNPYQYISISNCFVLESPKDSYGGLLKTDEELIQISKRRGGVGIDLSNPRPAKAPTHNSSKTSTGTASWMERYSNSIREVGQDGRRGALMQTISVHHPDILTFVNIKNDDTKVTGANISVRLTDEFLHAVENDIPYELRWPVDSKTPSISKKVMARDIWNAIIHSAWLRAEPGILFWDNILRESLPDCYTIHGYATKSTNPCFAGSEYLLTDNGYQSFNDLYNSQIEPFVLTDNRINYQDSNAEVPENWKIDNEKYGTSIRKGSNIRLTQKNVKLIKIETSRGFTIRCTPNHHIATSNGMIEAQNLKDSDNILIAKPTSTYSIIEQIPNTIDEKIALLIGLVAGDGTFDKDRNRVHLDFWGSDKERIVNICIKIIDELYEHFGPLYNKKNRLLSKYFIIRNDKIDKIRISSAWLHRILNDNYNFNRETKFKVPRFILNNSRTNISRFYLSGMYYADGSVQGRKGSGFSVRLSQSNKEFLQEIQLLCQSIGILTSIYKRRDSRICKFKDKQYRTKPQFELITTNGSIIDYAKQIGFIGHIEKEEKLSNIIKDNNIRYTLQAYDHIISISDDGYEDVYCLQEPETRSIIVNGISTRRCGEIPLSPYDSCRLLAINLFSCVTDPYTEHARFDYYKFYDIVQTAQRLMDDLVDLELECIDRILAKIDNDPEREEIKQREKNLWETIKKVCWRGRRTGLGITALGDSLAAINLKYGTDVSISEVDRIYMTLKFGSYRSSVDMAKELGAFPVWDWQSEKDNPFLLRLKDEAICLNHRTSDRDCVDAINGYDLWRDIQSYGRRNIANLTTAPTGTISTQASLDIGKYGLFFNTSSGIEPAIFTDYLRRKKGNLHDDNFRSDFVDQNGDHWQEFKVYHAGVKAWMAVNGKTEIDDSCPYKGALASEIDWVQRVKLQAVAQKHIDHSISSTINLPNNVTEEEVSKIYTAAWKNGLKGVTVYRDGCRTGVLVQDKKDEKKDRPKSLGCNIHHITVKSNKYFVLVGLLDGVPYEVFAGRNGILDKSIKSGKIVRRRANFYQLVTEDDDILLAPITATSDDKEEAITRLTSLSLRSGASIHYVVQQLEKVAGEMHTFARSIARALKEYIPDGTPEGEECPECKSNSVVRQSGCKTCTSCGYSACH